MLTKERIISFAQCTTQKTQAGIEGYFLQIDKNWGLKHYHEKQDAQVLYARQKWLAKLNAAPHIAVDLGIFPFYKGGGRYYGFVTEVVSVAAYDPRFLQEKKVDARWICNPASGNPKHYGILSQQHPLVKLLFTEGFVSTYISSPFDLHSMNIGYRADGQLVILDCGFGNSEDIVCIENTDIYKILKRNNIKFADFVSGERE